MGRFQEGSSLLGLGFQQKSFGEGVHIYMWDRGVQAQWGENIAQREPWV